MRAFFILMLLIGAVPARAVTPSYQTQAPIAYFADKDSGVVLLERAANKRIPTASMAKLMTAYVAFEAVKSGRVELETAVAVKPSTWARWNNRGSSMFLKAGQKATISDLLHGVLTLSGNDASVVLAEGIAGSEAAFIDEMNKTAKRLGMVNSHFATVNGWPDRNRTYSTAEDLSILARHILDDHPDMFARYFNRRSFRWNGITQINRNPLLGAVDGADGMKTGHSSAAGYCLVGTAKRGERRLIMVIAGLPSMEARVQEARGLMHWGFENWQERPVFAAGQEVARIPVQLGTEDDVAAIISHQVSLLGLRGKIANAKLIVRYHGPIKAPFKKGDRVGALSIHYPDGLTRTFPLVAAKEIPAAGFVERAWNGFRGLWSKIA